MEKTDTFFVIHNFNTVPEELIGYCKDYIIYDASTDEKITDELKKRGYRYIHIDNTGHNITSYFQYLISCRSICVYARGICWEDIVPGSILTGFTGISILHSCMKIKTFLQN